MLLCFLIRIMGGWNWVHSARRPLNGLLYLPRVIMMMENWAQWRLSGETEVLGENLSQRHFVHYKSHLPDLGSNPGRRGGKPATNRLSYGAAFAVFYISLFWIRLFYGNGKWHLLSVLHRPIFNCYFVNYWPWEREAWSVMWRRSTAPLQTTFSEGTIVKNCIDNFFSPPQRWIMILLDMATPMTGVHFQIQTKFPIKYTQDVQC
jgi:hypothetical protein